MRSIRQLRCLCPYPLGGGFGIFDGLVFLNSASNVGYCCALDISTYAIGKWVERPQVFFFYLFFLFYDLTKPKKKKYSQIITIFFLNESL